MSEKQHQPETCIHIINDTSQPSVAT